MTVSVVDLRCVFGRSLVVFDQSTLLFSSVSWTQGDLVLVRSTQDVSYGNTIITIYRSLYSSDMCSCRACSSNP